MWQVEFRDMPDTWRLNKGHLAILHGDQLYLHLVGVEAG
jgi:hypothetical protein